MLYIEGVHLAHVYSGTQIRMSSWVADEEHYRSHSASLMIFVSSIFVTNNSAAFKNALLETFILNKCILN